MERWNDDRLDDLANELRRELRQQEERLSIVENIKGELIELRSEVRATNKSSDSCIKELRQLKQDLERRAQAQHQERKADRRWMIGTVLATASLVIAALAIFVG